MVVTCPAGDSICNGKYYRPQRVPVASVQPIIHLLQVIQGTPSKVVAGRNMFPMRFLKLTRRPFLPPGSSMITGLPRGKYLVLSRLNGFNGKVEFFNVDIDSRLKKHLYFWRQKMSHWTQLKGATLCFSSSNLQKMLFVFFYFSPGVLQLCW